MTTGSKNRVVSEGHTDYRNGREKKMDIRIGHQEFDYTREMTVLEFKEIREEKVL